ncbi:MAG: glycogen synthase [Oscillospiraceae bacterium]|jgi:starch synthase|nr:glycogen synthase [Oscillospiraceae bacterium]
MVKVLFAVSEAAPYVATGGLGQVAGALPKALTAAYGNDIEVAVVCPMYKSVRQQFNAAVAGEARARQGGAEVGGQGSGDGAVGSGDGAVSWEFIGETRVQLAWRNEYLGVFKADNGVTVYFVDNMRYFDREDSYGYFDDGERFAFFCKAVFSVIEMTGFVPDVIHAHDWQSALVPIYLKTRFADRYANVRSVFTIHNVEYQGKFSPDILNDVLDLRENERGMVTWDNCINLMKGAIVCCDRLTTVSPSYSLELQDYGGYGLEPIIRENRYKLSGIINGIDTEIYNPATDKEIFANYSVDSPEGKTRDKERVQRHFGLPVKRDVPLICVISRLVAHKGIDLITQIAPDLMQMDLQFLLLGTGDYWYTSFFEQLAHEHPDKVGVSISYNAEIASMIYAGADIMLMPSKSEPCGLAQMIACRYGTIPIVRKVGGLKDTITDCRGGEGNGFTFLDYNAGELLFTVKKAIELYTCKRDSWRNLMREAMRSDFSWTVSAGKYMELYGGLV